MAAPFLHQPAFLPSLTTAHPPSRALGTKHRPTPLQACYAPLIPLVRLVRKPRAVLSWLLDELTAQYPSDTAEDDLEGTKALLRLILQNATTLEEWRTAAVELDYLEGNNEWKAEVESAEYNYGLVQSRLDELEEARISRDVDRMLFLIRTSLTRYLGGMGNTLLYKHSRIGTKALIERYISSALGTLSALLELTQRPRNLQLDTRDLLAQVLAARQAFGRSALLLSGGGTFGMNHIGVVKCLWSNRLLPRIVSGASAGSIVCAVLCTRTDEEVPQMLEEFHHGDLQVFTSAGTDDGILRQAFRFLTTGALFDISNLTRVMKGLLGDLTFQEAYNRTRRILNICVSSAGLFELPRLLNYVTAPNVVIWSAVAASCSVPVVYTSAGLLAKDTMTGQLKAWNLTPQRWIDGSVENDLPMTRLAEMFNVNHFIVSQVNPHVVPFLKREEDDLASEATQADANVSTGPPLLNRAANFAKDEVMHRMHVLSELGLFSNLLSKARAVLNQRYSGDITILPQISYSQFPDVLKNPDTEFMIQATLQGERATWPKISRIQNHCAIELALDDAVQQLRARIAFSPSQVDLRLNVLSSSRGEMFANPVNSKSNIGSLDSKNLRLSLGTHKKVRRSLSSSESDHMRPLPSLLAAAVPAEQFLGTNSTASDVSPSLLPHGRSFLDSDSRHVKSSDAALPGSETDPQAAINSWTMNTSNETDDSDDEYSDSPMEEGMASSLPTLWPSTRQLFPHASQPATPAYRSGQSYFNNARPSLATTPFAHPPPSAKHTHAMTPFSAGGSFQHFHERQDTNGYRRKACSGTTTPVLLDTDMSGTRGMVRRRKRSMSTGMKGLRPPGGIN